jgi:hypothetical protein
LKTPPPIPRLNRRTSHCGRSENERRNHHGQATQNTDTGAATFAGAKTIGTEGSTKTA